MFHLSFDASSDMIVLIDNYDSFTFNLVQRFGEVDASLDIRVYRNDQITIDQIETLTPSHLVISPGPCTPKEAGISNDVLKHFAGKLPILGVCLGHQCMAHTFGGKVVRAKRLVHGKTSMIRHDGKGVYRGMSNPFQATRYHSLIVDPAHVPDGYEVVAVCDDDPSEIMGMRHRTLPIEGVQYHPESFLTLEGHKLLANFLGIG